MDRSEKIRIKKEAGTRPLKKKAQQGSLEQVDDLGKERKRDGIKKSREPQSKSCDGTLKNL
jgi:hypothetical protein